MARFSPDRLRALREERHLPRETVALHLGKTVSAITKYEQGIITPSVPVLADLATVYGCDVGELFDRDDPADPVTAFATEITALVAAMPPMSPERRSRLRAILRGVALQPAGRP